MKTYHYYIAEDIPDVTQRLMHEMNAYPDWGCAGTARLVLLTASCAPDASVVFVIEFIAVTVLQGLRVRCSVRRAKHRPARDRRKCLRMVRRAARASRPAPMPGVAGVRPATAATRTSSSAMPPGRGTRDAGVCGRLASGWLSSGAGPVGR